jgi:uncharacterized protein YqeY
MGLEAQLDETLKQAMKDKDTATVDVVRMLKTRLMERRTAKGAGGAIDEATVQDVIASYRKQLQKAVGEFEKVGERGVEPAARLRAEIQIVERWLPRGIDEAALRALVQERIAALGVTDPRQVGRLVGDVMKSHKGLVDAADVKRVAEALLAG